MLEPPHEVRPASDLFFGRTGRVMATSRRDPVLKTELLLAASDAPHPTACGSAGMPLDGMGREWGILTEDGAVACTARFGYGSERPGPALFRHHGADPKSWPVEVRLALWP